MSFEQSQSQSLTTEFQTVQKDPLESLIPQSASSNPVPADVSSGLGGISGNVSYTGTAPIVIDSDLTITNISTLSGARVLIDNFDANRDILGINGVASGSENGVSWNYNQSAGVLTLDPSNSATNVSPDIYQSLLRRATYANTDPNNPGPTRTIQFSLGNALIDANTGNGYRFVDAQGISWTAARDAAATQIDEFGRQGYLATITSQAEQNNVQVRINGNGWIGASDSAVEGEWRWVTGPEGAEDGGTGRLFWRGTGADFNNNVPGLGAVGNNYNNWDLARNEPNNLTGGINNLSGEDYAHIVGNSGAGNIGKWNDLPDQQDYTKSEVSDYQPQGYVVEFSGLPANSSVITRASVTLSFNTVTNPGTTNVPNFNNVNVPQILWRNYGTDPTNSGLSAVWGINYDAANTTNAFTRSTDPKLTKYLRDGRESGWDIEGLYDVDGNGITDIFWRNYRTGENAVWFMRFDANTGVELDLARTQFLDPISDTSWRMEGVANFDNAGGPSILWHNYTTGQTAIWGYKFDASISGQSAFTRDLSRTQNLSTVVSTDWKVEGWADFNNDNVPDILWRNYNTGLNAIWKLNTNATGANPYFNAADGYYINPVADTSWKIADVIDFNKDGVADIVWRNYRTGENAYWGMQSGGDYNPAQTGYFNPIPDINWVLEGSADYTGDGIPDLVWRNYTTGENAIWRMKVQNNQYALDQGFFLGSAPDLPELAWEIEGPRPGGDFLPRQYS
ncbi:hypothetical protein NIES4071_84130 [Calothrix sp. NIES-4071]|nr:hypothetical protein NIES4071_84130 [Calothrix sp. NIES-4071]BAZ62681.1 hypothetical protein NIES4105_84060 [Calothrix sp. NIES-4105]